MGNKKGQAMVGVMTAITIFSIIGIIVVSIISNMWDEQSRTNTATDQTFTASNTTCVQLISSDCLYTGAITNVENASNGVTLGSGNYSVCKSTSYGSLDGVILDGAGAVDDGLYNGVDLNATYNFRSCSYIGSGTTRTILNLIPLLLALAVLVGVAIFIK